MEMTKIEHAALVQATLDSNSSGVQELSDLELVLVGGGTGDVAIG